MYELGPRSWVRVGLGVRVRNGVRVRARVMVMDTPKIL